MWETKFHTHIKQDYKTNIKSIFRRSVMVRPNHKPDLFTKPVSVWLCKTHYITYIYHQLTVQYRESKFHFLLPNHSNGRDLDGPVFRDFEITPPYNTSKKI